MHPAPEYPIFPPRLDSRGSIGAWVAMTVVMDTLALSTPPAFAFRKKTANFPRRILAGRDVGLGFGKSASYSLRGFDRRWGFPPTGGK